MDDDIFIIWTLITFLIAACGFLIGAIEDGDGIMGMIVGIVLSLFIGTIVIAVIAAIQIEGRDKIGVDDKEMKYMEEGEATSLDNKRPSVVMSFEENGTHTVDVRDGNIIVHNGQ